MSGEEGEEPNYGAQGGSGSGAKDGGITYSFLIKQAVAMAIQPAFSALDLCSSTPATTPSPNRIKIIVPMNSPTTGEDIAETSVVSYRLSVVSGAPRRLLPTTEN